MHNIVKKRTLSVLAGGALMALAGWAQAQYSWIDEKGMKQFSDRPPPSSVPKDKILKSPSGTLARASDPAPVSTADPAKAQPTLADKEADYQKRAKEKAESEQKAANKSAEDAKLQRQCEQLKKAKSLLDSGARIRSGEGFMDDAARSKESAEMATRIREACK